MEGTKEDIRVDIIPYETSHMQACIQLLAEAFAGNPLHLRAFTHPVVNQNKVFFAVGLRSFRGPRYVAIAHGRVVGFVHWVHSEKCRFPLSDKVKALPGLLRGVGLTASINVTRWLNAWQSHDPAHEHLHLGPIAVDPTLRGAGIGAALMERFCAAADQLQIGGYLETDNAENVDFYRRFGFELDHEADVLGVRNFFMTRAGTAYDKTELTNRAE